uniref:Uncharacterized protein n=1 Tax=Acrobeloides nanus TaxID=290746 RepID=A0A914CVL9_9BILA
MSKSKIIDDKYITERRIKSISGKPILLDNTEILDQFKQLSATILENAESKKSALGQAATKLVALFEHQIVPKLSGILSAQELERQRSIVIIGLPEPAPNTKTYDRIADEMTKIHNILDTIEVEARPVTTYRLGNRTDDPAKHRLLKVVFATRRQQNAVMASAKKLLSNNDYQKVYIRPSLTYEQRIEQKALLKELHERRNKGEKNLVIFKNKIVPKINKSGNGQH